MRGIREYTEMAVPQGGVEPLGAAAWWTGSNNLIWLNWGAIPRSTYQVQNLGTNSDASFGTNKWLASPAVTPSDRTVSIAVSPWRWL